MFSTISNNPMHTCITIMRFYDFANIIERLLYSTVQQSILLPLMQARKEGRAFGKKSYVSTGVRKPANT